MGWGWGGTDGVGLGRYRWGGAGAVPLNPKNNSGPRAGPWGRFLSYSPDDGVGGPLSPQHGLGPNTRPMFSLKPAQ